MDKEQKKALQNAYKTREVIGGVYCIRCSGNQRVWLRATVNLEGTRNKVMSSLKLKGAPEPSMQRECSAYGSESFSFELLEQLKKGEAQTDKEFSDDIQALLELWQEKPEFAAPAHAANK